MGKLRLTSFFFLYIYISSELLALASVAYKHKHVGMQHFWFFSRQADFKVETDRTRVKLSKWSNSRRKSGSLEARSQCSL